MRSLWIVCLLASGCYDVNALDRSFASDGGGARGGGGGGGGGSGGTGNWEPIAPPASATSFALRGVFGSGGEVVAVGASSTIVRLASAPGAESAPPGYNLRAVWLGAGGAFAVGDSETVLMRGGSAWNGASLGDLTLYAVTGLPGGGAVAVGSGGSIVHQEATTWVPDEEMPTVNVALFGVAARAAGDVIAVGEAGTVVHGTGSAPPLTWTVESSGVIGDLHAMWTSATETWIVGAGGVVLHAGTDDAWAPEASGTGADLFGISGDGDSLWAVGAGGTIVRRHAGAWSVEAAGGATLRAVFAAGNGEAWAVGDDGAILHRRP